MNSKDQNACIYICLIVLIVLLLWYILKPQQCDTVKLKGVWYMPSNLLPKYGLSQYILYFGENNEGYMVLVSDQQTILYNDQIKFKHDNGKLQIDTEQYTIFKQPITWQIKKAEQKNILKLYQGDENLGVFINVQ